MFSLSQLAQHQSRRRAAGPWPAPDAGAGHHSRAAWCHLRRPGNGPLPDVEGLELQFAIPLSETAAADALFPTLGLGLPHGVAARSRRNT